MCKHVFERAGIVSLVIVLLTVFLLTGCNSEPGNTESSVPQESQQEIEDMNGYEMVLATLWEWDVLPTEGTSELGDKVRSQYEQVQKDYNCKISFKATNPETITEDIATAVAAGDKYADFVHLDAPRIYLLRTKNLLRTLNDVPGLNLDSPIFNKSITEAFTDSKGVFGVSCSYKLTCGSYLVCNTSLLERLNIENPQKYVADRTWTFEKFREYLIKCTQDTDGDGNLDVWGLATGDWHANDFEKPMIWANGGSVLKKGADGKLTYGLNDDRVQTVLNYLNDIMFVRGLWKQYGVADYLDGNVAFLAKNVITETHLIHLEDNFTILPMPIGPDMDEYTSLCTATAWGVTSSNKGEDLQKAAKIFMAFNAPINGSVEADRDAWCEYYRYSYLRDDASVDVLKILADNTYVDISMGSGDLSCKVGQSIYSCTHSNESTPKAAMESIAPEVMALAEEWLSN